MGHHLPSGHAAGVCRPPVCWLPQLFRPGTCRTGCLLGIAPTRGELLALVWGRPPVGGCPQGRRANQRRQGVAPPGSPPATRHCCRSVLARRGMEASARRGRAISPPCVGAHCRRHLPPDQSWHPDPRRAGMDTVRGCPTCPGGVHLPRGPNHRVGHTRTRGPVATCKGVIPQHAAHSASVPVESPVHQAFGRSATRNGVVSDQGLPGRLIERSWRRHAVVHTDTTACLPSFWPPRSPYATQCVWPQALGWHPVRRTVASTCMGGGHLRSAGGQHPSGLPPAAGLRHKLPVESGEPT